MSSTNKTTHYDLSQYVGTDKPTYLSDYNSDMAKIDAALYEANTNASSAEANASTALTQAGQALSKANTNEGDIADLENVTNLLNTNVATLNSFMNEVESENITTTTLTPIVSHPSHIKIVESNLKMNTFDLNGLKLTSLYGTVTIKALTAITDRSSLSFTIGNEVYNRLKNRLFINIGTLIASDNANMYSIYMTTESSSAYIEPFNKFFSISANNVLSYFIQICILG